MFFSRVVFVVNDIDIASYVDDNSPYIVADNVRSSHRRCSVKIGAPRNFANSPENTCVRVSFFNEVAGLRPAASLKKKLWHRCFPVNFAKFLRTPVLQNTNVDYLITSFDQASNALFEWFQNNLWKSDGDKCHLLVSENYSVNINIAWYEIDKNNTKKLLEIKLDKKLTFDDHISDICKKAGGKISTLARANTIHGYCEEMYTYQRFLPLAV